MVKRIITCTRSQRSAAANLALRPISDALCKALAEKPIGCVSSRVRQVDAALKFDTAEDCELVELILGTTTDDEIFARLHVDAMVHDGPCLPAELNDVGVATWKDGAAAAILASPHHLRFLVV